jgi:hypothetical protein
MVELSTPYVNPDGLIKKVIKFNGKTRKAKNLVFIEERFSNRIDKLGRRKYFKKGRIVHEYFDKGRKDALKGELSLHDHSHIIGRST